MEIVPEQITATTCYHCGEKCEDEKIVIEDKAFCCEGCKLVYQILAENDLCTYYQLEDNPGFSLKGKRDTTYAYLEEKEVQESLLTFQNDRLAKVSFYLPQIHCSSCIWLLENLYKLAPGIIQSQVNFPKKKIQLTYLKAETNLRQLAELLVSIGYAPQINFDQLTAKEEQATNHTLTYKLGVTGFLFGNIMLISFPEYLGLQQSIYAQWFGYLNIALALPLLFYSAIDYLKSAYYGLKQGHLNIDVPVSLGMLALFGRSMYDILSHTGAGFFDSLAGLIFFLLVGKWFQQKTYYNLSFERDYRSYFPVATLVKKVGEWVSIPLNRVEPGDRLWIKNGELIPVDAVIVEGKGYLDYSFVTGEEDLSTKGIGDKVFAGGKLNTGSLELQVLRRVEHSYLTQLWNEQAFKKDKFEGRQSRLANTIAKYFTIVILIVATLTLAYWWTTDLDLAFKAFTAVLIIACPCAVALAIPFTYGNVLRLLARRKFYIRHIQVIEAIQEVNQVVLDKTGTLTDNKALRLTYQGAELKAEEKELILSMASQSSHPLSIGIAELLKNDTVVNRNLEVEEFPGLGLLTKINSKVYKLGSAAFVDFDKSHQKGVFWQVGPEVRGVFLVQNQYRKALPEFIRQLKDKFSLSLLSGDNDQEKERLSPYFDSPDQLHFDQSPKDKLAFVAGLQTQGGKVLMLGDGINDAGALRQSDVGLVLTEDINNFTPASDAIIAADHFQMLPDMLTFVRESRWVVYLAYLIASCYNIIGLSYAVQGLLSPVVAAILMPLSAITIVIIGVIGSSGLASWRLGKESDENHRWV
ncbi:MAG: heavy metal translocating P-type ATPase metal-binding domain-containing protein [Saprospiraceae bacterium]|nr:heavy metal translocating P-type ATPase metal-binding domain-containing protein [Saprospiraceae bacterium]